MASTALPPDPPASEPSGSSVARGTTSPIAAADRAGGLSSVEASLRLRSVGPNRLSATHQTLVRQIVARFANPLVLILLAASVVSALTGDRASAGVIAVIVSLSVVLDFVQERRAGVAAEKLARQVALRATVRRDGHPGELPAEELVPGDVVLLSAGDLIPADAEVLVARDFFVNQALLTGEPYPVERAAAQGSPPDDGDWDVDTTNAVFMGGSVVSGAATILVRRTGQRTAVGRIAASLDEPPPPTAFEVGTRRFGLLIMRLTLLLVLGTLLVNLAFHRPLLESFLFAVALAVGLTPELLPMVVSVTLARGALRMAKERVIVKRLSAIHDLGAMDVLCTDKTGTLTEAKIRLEHHLDADGHPSARVLELAYLNSHFETGLKSPMDDAILARGPLEVAAWKKLDEVPFDFERRRVSVLLERAGERLLVVKGAPEDVLGLSTRRAHDGDAPTETDLDEAARAELHARFASLGDQGYRALAIAFKHAAPTREDARVDDETELVFAGLVAFLDPPKASAGVALRGLAELGVSVKIVSGDDERVTRHVCEELGVPVRGVLLGREIAAMNDDALRARVEETTLFCRANPQQKTRVLAALRARGHVVGYMGDGINDAPSLHAADVAISVAGAVDVAKQAASMILLEQDLGVLVAGVREGRRTFGNVLKYVMMATSSNFGNMFSMAAATLLLPFLPMLPLQILLNNFLYDLSELALPLDEVDEEDVRRPRRWDMGFVRDFMLRIGPVSSVFDFITFFVLLRVLHAGEAEFHTGWFVESLATQVLVIFVIRTRKSPLASKPSRWLLVASISVLAAAIALPYTPFAPWLGFVPLPPSFFGILALLVAAYLALVEGVKRAFFRRLAVRDPEAPA